MAISFKGENNEMNIPISRALADVNLIVIIGQYVKNSDTLLVDCNQYFVKQTAFFFLYICFAFILFVNVFFICLTIILIRVDLIDPTVELTHFITHNRPQDKIKLAKYI
jgi:hypothetical protein